MAANLRRTALAYAALGWHIFPIVPDTKRPLTKNGFHEATDADHAINTWWEKWPDANIGLACGASGLIALDNDPAKMTSEAKRLWKQLLVEHPTLRQRTPTGGEHLIYVLPPDVSLTNSSGDLPKGIDTRVNGYVLLPPSRVVYHGDDAIAKGVADGYVGQYAWIDGAKPLQIEATPLPEHILALLKTKPETKAETKPVALPVYTNGNGITPYAQAALDNELDRLAKATEGERNETLNRCTFVLSQLVHGNALPETLVIQRLSDVAFAIGLEERETMRTIASGMKAGAQSARGVPETPKLIFGHKNVDAKDEIELPKELSYKAEDGGILDVWLALYGENWMFINGPDRWHHWRDTHWTLDEDQSIHQSIQILMERLNDRAREQKKTAGKTEFASEEEKKAAVGMANAYISATKRSRSRVGSVEAMAQANRGATVRNLNTGNVLNLANGVLDLETLALSPHDRTRLMTYCLPYSYDTDATCPRFRRFLYEVLVDEKTKETDFDLIKLFQELVGYTLTTDIRHEIMIWLAGEGGNGKTVAITILRELLGGMAGSVDFQTLGTSGNYDLADLPGKRLIFSTESRRGGHIAEELLRRIVSGEQINARPIYGTTFYFEPVAKVWWAMNDKPIIRDTSNATWRRLKLIPFNRTFTEEEKDIHLIDKLRQEMPGILNWALDGLARLRENGRFSSASSADAAAIAYRRESNPITQWMEERTTAAPTGLFPTKSSSAYSDYKTWSDNNGRTPMNNTNFGTEIKRAGVLSTRTMRGFHYNLALNDDRIHE